MEKWCNDSCSKISQTGTYTDRSTKNIKVINAEAGDVLILDARTWHGTTENKTTNSRWLITSALYLVDEAAS